MKNLVPPFQLHRKFFLTLFLMAIFIWSLFSIKWNTNLFHSGGIPTMMQIIHGLFHPALSPGILLLGLESAWITLSYAVAGMALAIIYAFIVGIMASGVLTSKNI
jgi:phosphonate transport system permease protein